MMRIFQSTTLQDGSDLPWCYEIPPIPTAIPVWGVNIVPSPIYASYTTDENGFQTPVGSPLYYEWQALLDPADTPIPDWITETTPPPAPSPSFPLV